jgi:Tripartite tricarboxylate transporter family receptor
MPLGHDPVEIGGGGLCVWCYSNCGKLYVWCYTGPLLLLLLISHRVGPAANPGKINLASAGTGNPTHLCGELLRMTTGIDVVHVPYRSW